MKNYFALGITRLDETINIARLLKNPLLFMFIEHILRAKENYRRAAIARRRASLLLPSRRESCCCARTRIS